MIYMFFIHVLVWSLFDSLLYDCTVLCWRGAVWIWHHQRRLPNVQWTTAGETATKGYCCRCEHFTGSFSDYDVCVMRWCDVIELSSQPCHAAMLEV